MRKESFRLAKATYTPISFWVSLTISELMAWIDDINKAAEEDKRRAKKK